MLSEMEKRELVRGIFESDDQDDSVPEFVKFIYVCVIVKNGFDENAFDSIFEGTDDEQYEKFLDELTELRANKDLLVSTVSETIRLLDLSEKDLQGYADEALQCMMRS